MSSPSPRAAHSSQIELLERVEHELRGPAGVTSGALDEIELAVGPLTEELRAYLLMARRGTRRILRVAEILQRTAQLDAGKVEWEMMPIDLRALAEQAVKERELLEARRTVHVSISCSEDACPVAADPSWMRFVIAELVGNAIRFARSRVSVRCEAAPDLVTIRIMDDGLGFNRPPAHRFDPPSDRRGVGLSLRLARDVVSCHGGYLELEGPRESGANILSGAIVIVTLPRLS